jgi:hypothetical protein
MSSFIIGGSSGSALTASALGTRQIKGDYTTLSMLRTFLSLGSADISDDNELRQFITRSSKAIDGYTRRTFFPQRKGSDSVLKYDLPKNRSMLRLPDVDLLEVKGLSHLNGQAEIDSSVYWLKTGDVWNYTPYDRIIMNDTAGSLFNHSGTIQQAIHVDAIVGFHSNYNAEGWIDSGASLTDALGATVNLASVSASGAVNTLGVSPRFSAGQIWKLGSGDTEEYVYVQDTVNTSVVRLLRGVNGTSAFGHSTATAIYTWQPERDIEFSTTELAAFMYQKSKSPFTNRVSILQLGVVEQAETWPEQTLDRLNRYKRDRIYAL